MPHVRKFGMMYSDVRSGCVSERRETVVDRTLELCLPQYASIHYCQGGRRITCCESWGFQLESHLQGVTVCFPVWVDVEDT